MATHEVTNQVPDFVGHDLFATDPVLVDAYTTLFRSRKSVV